MVSYYQFDEVGVVGLADTVVEPFAVVVEFGNAFVTIAAMFGFGADV